MEESSQSQPLLHSAHNENLMYAITSNCNVSRTCTVKIVNETASQRIELNMPFLTVVRLQTISLPGIYTPPFHQSKTNFTYLKKAPILYLDARVHWSLTS